MWECVFLMCDDVSVLVRVCVCVCYCAELTSKHEAHMYTCTLFLESHRQKWIITTSERITIWTVDLLQTSVRVQLGRWPTVLLFFHVFFSLLFHTHVAVLHPSSSFCSSPLGSVFFVCFFSSAACFFFWFVFVVFYPLPSFHKRRCACMWKTPVGVWACRNDQKQHSAECHGANQGKLQF